MAKSKKKKKAPRAKKRTVKAAKAKKPARKATKTRAKTKPAKRPAKKAVAAKKKPAPRKAAKAKAPKRKAREVLGEGNYTASRRFREEQTGFVKRNKAKIASMGEAAEAALEGSEGDALRAAEQEAASHAHIPEE